MDDNQNNNDLDSDNTEFDFLSEDLDDDFGKCPSCKEETLDLEIVDDFTKLALAESNIVIEFDSVCSDCLINYNDQITHIGKMKAEQKQKMEALLNKWNNKIDILKTGRSLMSQKIYPEAQRLFEEYIQILEAVFNNGEEGLKPKMISEEHRKHEATLLCHLFWDLIYIYDNYEPGTAKLQNMCRNLCEFLPFARGKSSIVRKIHKYIKQAKHDKVIKKLFNDTKVYKGSCFIATAVFDDDPNSLELYTLRNFRDQCLRKSYFGRNFVYYYYKYSPFFAAQLKKNVYLKLPVKICLKIASFFLVKLKF